MLISVRNLTPNSLSTDLGLIGPHELKSAEFAPDLAYKACEGLYALKSAGFITITVSNESDIASEQLIPTTGDYDSRPVNAAVGHQYFDTDNGCPIWWDGANWNDATVNTDIAFDVGMLNKLIVVAEPGVATKANVAIVNKTIDGSIIEEEVDVMVEVLSATAGAGALVVTDGTLVNSYYAVGSKTQTYWIKTEASGIANLTLTNTTASELSLIKVSSGLASAVAITSFGT